MRPLTSIKAPLYHDESLSSNYQNIDRVGSVLRMNKLAKYCLIGVFVATTSTSCAPGDVNRSTRVHSAFLDIVAIQDARPEEGIMLDRLTAYTRSENRFIRAISVRALGRLENPTLASAIEELLSDPAPEVRIEAANALAQAHFGADGSKALNPLMNRADVEVAVATKAAIAKSIGRLQLDIGLQALAAERLLQMSYMDGGDAPGEVMEGVALGIEALARSTNGSIVQGRVMRRLDELRMYLDGTITRTHQARVRSLAINVLGRAGQLDLEQIRIALRDESHAVKAAGARWISVLPRGAIQGEGLRQVMFSRSVPAQVEGLRFLLNQPRTPQACSYLKQGARVPASGTTTPLSLRVLSIDGLAEPCPDSIAQRSVLLAASSPSQLDSIDWQPASHALVALAHISPDAAANVLDVHAMSPEPFVRAYAARAAGIIGERTVVDALLQDPMPNVRTESLRSLARLDDHAADAAAIDQLVVEDPQLIMAATAVLEGSTDPEAAHALADALDRMSEEGRETFRDARRALLDRLEELGDPGLSERLLPYLSDYDELVAEDAAKVLESWNGRAYLPNPIPRQGLELPTIEQLREMAASIVVLHMRRGGEIHIVLHPYVSTANTWRFFTQVREGYFDGLTFHRWSPNFVIQGGSPNANEYYGSGPFSRDEVGMHHWQGTVGISTRGHDTGDGQIFVNLMDNPRLDHQYTIIGTVTEGLEVVGLVNEGDVIEGAEVRLIH